MLRQRVASSGHYSAAAAPHAGATSRAGAASFRQGPRRMAGGLQPSWLREQPPQGFSRAEQAPQAVPELAAALGSSPSLRQQLEQERGLQGELQVAAAPTSVVNFHLSRRCQFGQCVKVVGSAKQLGSWDLDNALEMQYTPGDQWVASAQLTVGGVYEYKYVIIDYASKQAVEWQGGGNAVLAVVVDEYQVDVYDNWGNDPGALVKSGEESATREGRLQKWANYMLGFWGEAQKLRDELMLRTGENQGLRNELSQLRMELSLEQQAREGAAQEMRTLRIENSHIKQKLMHKTVELNRTLAEVLQMFEEGLLEDEELKSLDASSSQEEQAQLQQQVLHSQQHADSSQGQPLQQQQQPSSTSGSSNNIIPTPAPIAAAAAASAAAAAAAAASTSTSSEGAEQEATLAGAGRAAVGSFGGASSGGGGASSRVSSRRLSPGLGRRSPGLSGRGRRASPGPAVRSAFGRQASAVERQAAQAKQRKAQILWKAAERMEQQQQQQKM